MAEEQDSSEVSLINSIASTNLRDMVIDSAEIALDAVMDEGILKEIPFFGFWTKTYGVVTAVREQLFIKKVYSFLRELRDVTTKERRKFVENLGDIKEQRKAGEAIILLLDRMDNMAKPVVVGKLYRACIQGHISHDDFLRISTMVERVYYDDLEYLVTKYNQPRFYIASDMMLAPSLPQDTTKVDSLANAGLLKAKIVNARESLGTEQVPTVLYQISKCGVILVEQALLNKEP